VSPTQVFFGMTGCREHVQQRTFSVYSITSSSAGNHMEYAQWGRQDWGYRQIGRYPIENLAEALAEGIVVGHPAMPRCKFEPRDINVLLTTSQGSNRASLTGKRGKIKFAG
jgi:hypothetical protein